MVDALRERLVTLLALLSLVAVVAGCASGRGGGSEGSAATQAASEGQSSAKDSVRAELLAYYSDFSARDWPAFASHFWPGADITTIWQPPGEDRMRVDPTSVEEFIAAAPRGPGSRSIFEERMISFEVRIFRNLAQAWVRYHARFGEPGDILEWEGIDAFTLLELNGQWKIAALVFAGDEP